jgi:hypothetical protein
MRSAREAPPKQHKTVEQFAKRKKQLSQSAVINAAHLSCARQHCGWHPHRFE